MNETKPWDYYIQQMASFGMFPRRKREITLEEGDVLAIDLGNGTRIVMSKDDGEISVKKQHQRVVWEDDPVDDE